MPWLVGIDEAGYGPNLGPLVVASVSVFLPDGAPSCAEILSSVVRRAADDDDGRLIVDDSKQVHVGPNGLAKLERAVLPVFLLEVPSDSWTLGDYVDRIAAATSATDLQAEPWYDAAEVLPVEITAQEWADVAGRISSVGIDWGPIRSVIMPTPRFNALLDHWQNKACVEASAVISLLQEARALPGVEPVVIAVDRLGGRTHYAAIIQTAYPDGWVVALEESAECCRYTLAGLERHIELSFQPRAESEHLPVALASMTCKYLREICMRQFNRYWQARVPGLKPTAGYPVDAGRFFQAIRGVMRQLRLSADQVWRRK
jgi:hypothetical protein